MPVQGAATRYGRFCTMAVQGAIGQMPYGTLRLLTREEGLRTGG